MVAPQSMWSNLSIDCQLRGNLVRGHWNRPRVQFLCIRNNSDHDIRPTGSSETSEPVPSLPISASSSAGCRSQLRRLTVGGRNFGAWAWPLLPWHRFHDAWQQLWHLCWGATNEPRRSSQLHVSWAHGSSRFKLGTSWHLFGIMLSSFGIGLVGIPNFHY